MSIRRTFFPILLLLAAAAPLHAEVLVRWDQKDVPSRDSLGITALVVPAAAGEGVKAALAAGYRVYLEVDAAAAAGPLPSGIAGLVVKGKATPAQMRLLRQRLASPGARVIAVEEGGKWPHVRSNWVTKNRDGVLQVTGRSAQPWIENNAALLRIARAAAPASTPVLTYSWQPITLSDVDEGPALENYLVAIAEAGSFGADLVLPLHERFERRLLLGQPQARSEWEEIRRYLQFYSWSLPARYEPLANVGVVTDNPALWFETMNLLARHNLPFELIRPSALPARDLAAIDLLIVLDAPGAAQQKVLEAFRQRGGTVRVLAEAADPNAFALEMRRLLGREERIVDIWNGITVLAAPYEAPEGSTTLVTLLNYAHQPLPVQVRVAGTFTQVQYESPEEAAVLLPYQHREGCTEFTLPTLRVGARVFLTHRSPLNP